MGSCGRALTLAALLLAPSAGVMAEPRTEYTVITAREAVLRRDLDTQTADTASPALLTRLRAVVAEYLRLADGEPGPFTDDALWQAGTLSADAYWAFGEEADRLAALRTYGLLRTRFPGSPLARQASSAEPRLAAAPHRIAATAAAVMPATSTVPAAAGTPIVLTTIRRESLPDALRIVLALERETTFRDERLADPPRVFVDLKHTRAVPSLRDVALTFPDDVVRQVRVGRPDGDTTRVVLDLQDAGRYSVYPLYQPYRLVIDFERPVRPVARPPAPRTTAAAVPRPTPAAPPTAPKPAPSARAATALPVPLLRSHAVNVAAVALRGTPVHAPAQVAVTAPTAVNPAFEAALPPPVAAAPGSTASAATPVATPAVPAALAATSTPPATLPPPAPPSAPAANLRGGFSLSRQLGLGVSRVVIDAGHGGHDPGARVKGLNEADVVLDIALRLEKLLTARQIDVVLTRRANVYVPLEQRTAIANREEADLFLSIHANASDNPKARGIETYFLNFAANPDAERVAARENASAGRTMHSLPEIVKAIALNNKINESRDFASYVQAAMLDRLRKANGDAKDLGVKQAPFMVLIGATMPSVLAEISFITNRDEAGLLKTAAYRQQVAESLLAGVLRYQRALKTTPAQTVAAQQ